MGDKVELRYLPCQARLDIRILAGSISHVIYKEFVSNQFKLWVLSAQGLLMNVMIDYGKNIYKVFRK